MATTPSVADQLRAYQESLEYANRTAEAIKDQRDLLSEVARQAQRINVAFNNVTENIGDSVKQVKLFETTERQLSNSIRDRDTIEKSLLSQLKNRSRTQKDLDVVSKLNNTATRSAALTELENRRKMTLEQYKSGAISKESMISSLQNIKNLRSGGSKLEASLRNQLSIQDSYIGKTKDNLRLENIALDKLRIKNGFMQVGKKVLGDMGPLGSAITESFNVAKMNPWVAAAQVATAILEKGFENFKAFDKASVDVRKNLGALPGQASVLEKNLKTVTIDMMHLGATFDDVAKSINEITNEFTGLVAQDENLVKSTTALAKQFGIAEGTSVKFLKTLGGISGDSASSQKSMIGFAQKMAQASGVPLGKIMQDVADASDDVRVYVGSSAVSMIKAATAARMMGIDLNKAAASAEKLLQFESSINAELKASALLGQNVNFNYARQLAFNKDIIGSNKEILRITKQVNFSQLDPIKQKAFADAAGKSVGELQDMLTQEKNIQLVKNGTNEQAKKALADYERMMQLKDEEAKNEGKVAEQQILQKANQERLNQLQNQFNKLMSELAKPVMDVIEPLLDVAVAILPPITKAILLLTPIAGIFGIFAKIKWLEPFFQKIGGYITTIGTKLTQLGKIGKMFASVGKFLGVFGRFMGPIGIIINAFTFISSLMKRWEEAPDGFLGGLQAIGLALYDTFLQPFVDAWDWISSIFVGKSPSELGLGIVKGIKSVGGMLLDVLTLPFRTGYNFISGLFGGSEMKAPSEVLSDVTDDTKKAGATAKSINNDVLIQTIQSGNQQLVAKIDQLIQMMANGGIAVNINGQKVNDVLARTALRSGGFGQSTTLA